MSLHADPCIALSRGGSDDGVSALYANGTQLYAGTRSGAVRALDASDLSTASELAGHTGRVTAIVAAGDRLISASMDKSVILREGPGLSTVRRLGNATHPVNDLASDDGHLYGASSSGEVLVWGLGDLVALRTLVGHSESASAVFADEAGVFSGSYDRSVVAWGRDAASSGERGRHIPQPAEVTALAGDASHLVSATADGHMRIWRRGNDALELAKDIDTGLAGGVGRSAIAVGHGHLFAGVGHAILVWRLSDVAEVASLGALDNAEPSAGHTRGVTALSAGGGRVFSADGGGRVVAWDLCIKGTGEGCEQASECATRSCSRGHCCPNGTQWGMGLGGEGCLLGCQDIARLLSEGLLPLASAVEGCAKLDDGGACCRALNASIVAEWEAGSAEPARARAAAGLCGALHPGVRGECAAGWLIPSLRARFERAAPAERRSLLPLCAALSGGQAPPATGGLLNETCDRELVALVRARLAERASRQDREERDAAIDEALDLCACSLDRASCVGQMLPAIYDWPNPYESFLECDRVRRRFGEVLAKRCEDGVIAFVTSQVTVDEAIELCRKGRDESKEAGCSGELCLADPADAGASASPLTEASQWRGRCFRRLRENLTERSPLDAVRVCRSIGELDMRWGCMEELGADLTAMGGSSNDTGAWAHRYEALGDLSFFTMDDGAALGNYSAALGLVRVRWEEVPGSDEGRLRAFLGENLRSGWLANASALRDDASRILNMTSPTDGRWASITVSGTWDEAVLATSEGFRRTLRVTAGVSDRDTLLGSLARAVPQLASLLGLEVHYLELEPLDAGSFEPAWRARLEGKARAVREKGLGCDISGDLKLISERIMDPDLDSCGGAPSRGMLSPPPGMETALGLFFDLLCIFVSLFFMKVVYTAVFRSRFGYYLFSAICSIFMMPQNALFLLSELSLTASYLAVIGMLAVSVLVIVQGGYAVDRASSAVLSQALGYGQLSLAVVLLYGLASVHVLRCLLLRSLGTVRGLSRFQLDLSSRVVRSEAWRFSKRTAILASVFLMFYVSSIVSIFLHTATTGSIEFMGNDLLMPASREGWFPTARVLGRPLGAYAWYLYEYLLIMALKLVNEGLSYAIIVPLWFVYLVILLSYVMCEAFSAVERRLHFEEVMRSVVGSFPLELVEYILIWRIAFVILFFLVYAHSASFVFFTRVSSIVNLAEGGHVTRAFDMLTQDLRPYFLVLQYLFLFFYPMLDIIAVSLYAVERDNPSFTIAKAYSELFSARGRAALKRSLIAFALFALVPAHASVLGIHLPLWLVRLGLVALNFHATLRAKLGDLHGAMRYPVVHSRFEEIEPSRLVIDTVASSSLGLGMLAGVVHVYRIRAHLLIAQMLTSLLGAGIHTYFLKVNLVMLNPQLLVLMITSAFG